MSRVLLLLGVPAIGACAQMRNINSAPEVVVDSTPVHIELSYGRPFVEVRINGQGPYPFVVDTGASLSVVDPELVKILGLPTRATSLGFKDGFDAKHNVQSTATIDEMAVGRSLLRGIEAAVIQTQPLPRASRARFLGVLGLNVFRNVVLTLDYPASAMTLSEGSLPPVDGNETLSFFPFDNVIGVDLQIDGATRGFKVDSGSSEVIEMDDATMDDATGGKLPFETTFQISGARSSVGPVQAWTRIARLGTDVALGGYRLRKPLVTAAPTNKIGGGLLKHFKVSVDLKDMRIQFVRDVRSPIEFPAMRIIGAGIRYTPQGPLVVSLWPGFPASSVLHAGDRILAVDGVDASGMEPLPVTQDVVRLTVERHGTRLELDVPVAKVPSPSASEVHQGR